MTSRLNKKVESLTRRLQTTLEEATSLLASDDSPRIKLQGVLATLESYSTRLEGIHDQLTPTTADDGTAALDGGEDAEDPFDLILDCDEVKAKLKVRLTSPVTSTTSAPTTSPLSPSGQGSRARLNVKLPKLVIPTFDGDVLRWQEFWDSFNSSIHCNEGLTSVDKFNYLNSLLVGEAKLCISGLPLTSLNYDTAISLLKGRFANKPIIVNSHYKALISIPAVKSDNTKSLRFTFDLIQKHLRCLEALGESTNSNYFLTLITSKLPLPVLLKVEEQNLEIDMDVEALCKTIQNILLSREKSEMILGLSESRSKAIQSSSNDRSNKPFAADKNNGRELSSTAQALTSGTRANNLRHCVFCDGDHWNDQCSKYTTVYRVLRQVDKEDKFRFCVKQLAIDWQVPLTRLTDEQLRPYRREYNRADSIESSATDTTNAEEVGEVLDACENDDGSKEGISQDYSLGNKSLKIETSQGTSLQDNVLKDETSQNSLIEEKYIENIKENNDLNNLKVSTGNTQSSLNSDLEDKNLQNNLSENNSLRDNILVNTIGIEHKSVAGISSDNNILSNFSDYDKINNISTENGFSDNSSLDDNDPKENFLRGKTPSFSTVGVILMGNNTNNDLSKDDPFIDHSSKDDSLVDVSREKIIKYNTSSYELHKENALHIKRENNSLKNSENNDTGGSLCIISKDKSLISDTSKNISCQEDDPDDEKRSHDELCFSDDSDFESAERGLQEALKLSEKDVTLIERKPRTMNAKTVNILINKKSAVLHHLPLPNKIDEYIKLNEGGRGCIQSKKCIILKNIVSQTNTDCRDSSANQEHNCSSHNIKIQASPDSQQCENHLLENKTYRSNICLQFSTPSSCNKKTNLVKKGVVENKDKAEIISSQMVKSGSSEEFNLLTTTECCHKQPVSDGKVDSTEETANNFQCSLHGMNTTNGKVVVPVKKIEKNVVKRSPTFSSSKKTFNYNTKLVMSQEERKYTKSEGSNLVSVTEKSKINIFQACIAKEAGDPLYKTSLGKDKGSKINILHSNEETNLSSHEKHLLQNWWTKYRCSFENENICSSLHYPTGILDYDNETWPDISEEPNGKHDEPKKILISSLLSELKDLEQETNMSSTLQESTSESELEVSEEILNDESIPPVPETQAEINFVPSLLASKTFHSIVTNPGVQLLNDLMPQYTINLSNPAEKGISLLDNTLPIEPPLPSYSPPRTPSPPPLPSPSLETLPPASPPCSLSSSSMPYKVLSQEKLSNFLSNIPLPPSAPALSRLETQQSIPQNFKTWEAQKISEPLSSRLNNPTLNKSPDSKHLQYSNSESEFKLLDLPSQQKMSGLISQTTKSALPLSNSESQRVVAQVLPLHETQKLKHSSLLCNKGLIKSGIFPGLPPPTQVFPLPKSSSQMCTSLSSSSSLPKPVQTPLLSSPAASSNQSFQDLTEGRITKSVAPQKSSEINETIQEKDSRLYNRDNFVLCRSTLRKKNLYIIKCWKLKVKFANIKNHPKKARIKKSHLFKTFKVKKNTTKVLQNKGLNSRMIESLVSAKQRLDVFKKNCLKEHACHKTDIADSTLLPVGEVYSTSSESSHILDIKREFSSDMENCLSLDMKKCLSLSSLSLAIEKCYSKQLIPQTEMTIEKEESSFECQNEECFPKDEISLDVSLENSEVVSKILSPEENKKDGMVPTILSVVSTGTKPPQSIEMSGMCEFENEDNKFRQFVDESIPGDPIACKYVEDEENIEISFEPITHNSTNIDWKFESAKLSTVQPAPETSSSLVELGDSMPNKNYLLNDLQVSSSDEESEEECYIRPRIINGFGDPFIIPHSQERNYLLDPTKENVTSSNLIKMEGSPKCFQDLEQLSKTLPDVCTLTKKEFGMVFSPKSPSQHLQGTNQTPKNNGTVTSEPKSIKTKKHSTSEISINKIRDKNTSKNSKQIKNRKPHLKERKIPLKPKIQFENSDSGSEKKKEKSSTYKYKTFCENRDKIRGTNAHKLQVSKYLSKIMTNENDKSPRDITRNTTSTTHPALLKSRHGKSRGSKQNTLKTDSYIPLCTDNNPKTKKDNVDTNLKNRQKNTQNGCPPNKTTQKENTSYQPSSIRKRLTSEVENIIPIKKDLSKTCKSQISFRNVTTPLKRTYSLPEEPSVKIVNPVVDSIVKDMDASPPPKSLVIKELETQKYVAQAYWCNQSSPPVSHPSNALESPFRKNDLNNQTRSTPSECQSVNKDLTEGNLESNQTLRRSISLNSNFIDKKEKNRNPSFTPKETISFFKRCINKSPYRAKKTSGRYKSARNTKFSMQKGVKIKNQEIPVSPQVVCDLNCDVENRKIRESLPSMPLIEFESNLNNSAEKPIDIVCKTFASHGVSTAINKSKNVQPYVTSFINTSKPSIKVSIPISYFISLNGELARDWPPPKKSKTEKHANGNVSNSHSEVSSEMGDIHYYVKTKSKDLKNSLTKEKLHSQRNVQKIQERDEVTKERSIPVEIEQNSKDIAIKSSSLARSYANNFDVSNLSVVIDQKLQSKTKGDKLIQHSSSLKRPSTESESECPSMRKKLRATSFDNLELHVELNRDIKTSCLDKEKESSFTTSQADSSGRSPVDNDLYVQAECNVREGNLRNSEQCEQLETTIPHSLPLDEVNLKILKDLAYSNDLQISMTQENISNIDATHCETSIIDGGGISKNGSLPLRVKHPSLLQTGINVELGPQELPRRRISVISPEALSSGVQSNDQENIKRHTWYMEPENISTDKSKLPSQDPKINNCKAISLFCNLLEEPNKKTELINTFKTSIKIGKKEYEGMHDVIKCIELDYKQKQDVIESVKKLQSRDVVKQEIKRATNEYENKLAERESFFRKTFTKLLDHFKNATDYVYLAFYVFLSQKVEYLCSETALKDSLLSLLKSWIRNDYNKHVFDQSDSAFSNDCEIMLKIMREIENFSLLLSGVNTSILNQSPRNEREENQVDFSLKENNSQENGTNTLTTTNTNKDTVAPIDLDFSLPNCLVNDLSEPQPFTFDFPQTPTQSQPSFEGVEQNTNLQSADCSQPLSEFSTTIEPTTTKSANVMEVFNVFENLAPTQNQTLSSNLSGSPENRKLQSLHNLEVSVLAEVRTADITTNKKPKTCTITGENQPIISSQELIQQEIFAQPGVPISTSQCVQNNNRQPQFLAQPVSNNSSISFNEDAGLHKQRQGLANVWSNACVNIALRQNNCPPQVALRGNTNSNVQHPRYQIQHETTITNYPLLNSSVSQTNNTIDKYQSMRQGKEKSNITDHTTNLLYREHNIIPSAGPYVARQTFVRNESSFSSSSCAQNVGPYHSGDQTGTSQPLTAPLVYPVYPQLQNVQVIKMQQHSNNMFNQNRGFEETVQRCQTQSSNQEYPYTSHRAGQTLQPKSNYYPVQPSQHQVAQYIWRKNTNQQLGQENHNLTYGKITNNVFLTDVTNPQLAQYLSNNNLNCSKSHSQDVHQPVNTQQTHFPNNQRQVSQEMSWQKTNRSCLENQFNPNTDTRQFGNMIQDMLTNPAEQNITCQSITPQIQMRSSNFKIQNRIDAHPLNHPPTMSNTSHTSAQILQNNGQNVTVQHELHRRFSNDDISTLSIKQPLNQSYHGTETSKRLYHYQKNTSGNQVSDNRRSSIETTQPSQQTSTQFIPLNSSSNQLLAPSVFSEGNIHESVMNHTQREVYYNVPVDPKEVLSSSGHVQSRRKSSEMSEQTDLNSITEADLIKLFNLVDSEKIMELMKSTENKDDKADQQNVNRNILNPNKASTSVQTSINYNVTKQTALLNIDNNLQIIAKLPDVDLNFNGVNITKEQLLKFVDICRKQVSFAGLREDRETTFIGQYTTADGRSFSREELTSLMKGAIAMNARKITKTIEDKEKDKVEKLEKKRSKSLLIQTLKATAFKDVASYLRIIDILKGLARDNDKDAQEAVQEIADILRIFRQPEQIVSSNPVIVIDD